MVAYETGLSSDAAVVVSGAVSGAASADAGVLPGVLPGVPSAPVTWKSTLRVVAGSGARKRSQCAPVGVPAGTVTSPSYEPFASVFHWPRIASSSSLTVTVWPAGKFVTAKCSVPPACT